MFIGHLVESKFMNIIVLQNKEIDIILWNVYNNICINYYNINNTNSSTYDYRKVLLHQICFHYVYYYYYYLSTLYLCYE